MIINKKTLAYTIILIILLIFSIYFSLKVIVTMQGVVGNQNILGNTYEQYLWNSILQLLFMISIILCLINLLMIINLKLFNNKPIYRNRILIATIIYTLFYIFFFVYLQYNSVNIWNPLFMLLAGLSIVPLSPIIVHSIASIFLKKLNSKVRFN